MRYAAVLLVLLAGCGGARGVSANGVRVTAAARLAPRRPGGAGPVTDPKTLLVVGTGPVTRRGVSPARSRLTACRRAARPCVVVGWKPGGTPANRPGRAPLRGAHEGPAVTLRLLARPRRRRAGHARRPRLPGERHGRRPRRAARRRAGARRREVVRPRPLGSRRARRRPQRGQPEHARPAGAGDLRLVHARRARVADLRLGRGARPERALPADEQRGRVRRAGATTRSTGPAAWSRTRRAWSHYSYAIRDALELFPARSSRCTSRTSTSARSGGGSRS